MAVNPALVELLGSQLQKQGANVATEQALSGKQLVLLYFSAHWCPPCRRFTPIFAKAYREAADSGKCKDVEVIFVSGDRDEAAFNEYYGEMPWLALPYGSEARSSGKLNDQFGVEGIPHLALVKVQGSTLNDTTPERNSDEIRTAITNVGASAFPFTSEAFAAVEQVRLDAEKVALRELTAWKVGSPGGTAATVGDLLGRHTFVTIVFSDADSSDGHWAGFKEAAKRADSAVVYVAFSSYEGKTHEWAGPAGFHVVTAEGAAPDTILPKSHPAHECLGKLGLQNAPSAITLRSGPAGLPDVVSKDVGCRNAAQFPAALPWDAKTIADLRAAQEAEKNKLRSALASPGFGGALTPLLRASDCATPASLPQRPAAGGQGVVGIYVSAHWCPPCRAFTPVLAELHRELNAAGKSFELVFVSLDKDEESFKQYAATMPWLTLPFDRSLAQSVAGAVGAKGIPHLFLADAATGETLSENARGVVTTYGAGGWPYSKEAIAAADAALKAANAALIEAARKEGKTVVLCRKGHMMELLKESEKRRLLCDGCRNAVTYPDPVWRRCADCDEDRCGPCIAKSA